MLKAIIFDIDGTLVDSVDLHARAWREAFRHFGREVEFEKVRHQIGKGGDQLMPVFFPREELERFGEEMEKFRGDIYKREYISRVRAFPQVRELFERIRRDGKRIALASSAKRDELKVYKELARIADLIEEETSADDAEKSKPHPDIFEAALAALGDVRAAKPSSSATRLRRGGRGQDQPAHRRRPLRRLPRSGTPRRRMHGHLPRPADLLARFDASPLASVIPRRRRPPPASD
jgi:beta-phosphoglucomutase-like phosphatase (HAD superfamily)